MTFFGHFDVLNRARFGLVHQLHAAQMLSAQLISFVEAVHNKPHCLFGRVKDSCAFRNCFADICLASAVFVSSGLYCIVKQPLFINVYFVFWF